MVTVIQLSLQNSACSVCHYHGCCLLVYALEQVLVDSQQDNFILQIFFLTTNVFPFPACFERGIESCRVNFSING